MSGGILRFPWTSQPQIPTGIDYGNPITSGLVFLTLPGLRQANIVDGKSFGGSKGKIEAGSKGIGAYAPTSTTYPTVTATLGQNYTLFSFGNVTTSGVAGSMIDDDDGSTRAFLFRIIASGAPDFTPFTAANAPVGITGSVFTAAQLSAGVAVAATMNSSGSGAVWGNGVKTTGSLGAAPRSPSTTIALLNRKSGGTQIPTTKPVYICAGWNRVLSDGEIASLSANPWQLFTPIQRTIWVPAAAGGGTTISGALGTAVASGFTGTVNANRTIAGALGAASASGFKGNVNANRTVAGALGTAVASGFTGTVANSTNTTISGNLGVAAASGFKGNVSANRTIAGSLGTAVASGFTGTVGANRGITGALGTAVASGFTGTVNNSNDTTINGNIGTAVASGFNGGVAFNRFLAGLLGTAVASGFTGTVGTTSPTIGRPASDTSNSGWTPSTGSDLYAMLDEVTPDDADYIVTTATGSICKIKLQTTAYPGTSAQKLSYRASSSTGNSVIVRLKNTGGATVRTKTQVLTSTDTLYEITLTAPEIAAITSGALSVELESA